MFPENFKRIGLLSKTHGIDGTGLLRIAESFKEDLFEKEFLFVSVDATMIPFFVEEISVVGNDAFVKFRGINSEKDFALIKGKDVFLASNKQENSKDYFSYIGFKVEDKTSGKTGTISEYHEQEENPLFVITSGDDDYLIPARQEFFLSVDEAERLIEMSLPQGLFDLNN